MLRQLRAVRDNFRVTACGFEDPRIEKVEFVPVTSRPSRFLKKVAKGLRLICRRFETFYWDQPHVGECLERLSKIQADIYLSNELDTLPAVLQLAGARPVVFDAHEFSPKELEESIYFRVFFQNYYDYLARTYIPLAREMTTVSQGIADAYHEITGAKAHVVWNAPDYQILTPHRSRSDTRIKLVHHGGALKERRLESLIEMMDSLDERFELHLVLVEGSPGYLDRLKKRSEGNPRIQFWNPVPMRDLPAFLNQFDVGVYSLPPSNYNHRFALPNKFFDFIQARLTLVIGPSPEMSRIVREHDIGIVAADFSAQSMAAAVAQLTKEKIEQFKTRSNEVARHFSSEAGRRVLLSVLRKVQTGVKVGSTD